MLYPVSAVYTKSDIIGQLTKEVNSCGDYLTETAAQIGSIDEKPVKPGLQTQPCTQFAGTYLFGNPDDIAHIGGAVTFVWYYLKRKFAVSMTAAAAFHNPKMVCQYLLIITYLAAAGTVYAEFPAAYGTDMLLLGRDIHYFTLDILTILCYTYHDVKWASESSCHVRVKCFRA